MVSRCAEGSETKANIEARFPHGPVALVVVGAQLELMRMFAPSARRRRRSVAYLLRVGSTRTRLRFLRQILKDVTVRLFRMKKKIRGHLPVKSGLILYRFRRRTLPKIVVSRQACIACAMW